MSKVGRPLKFKTVEELQEKVDRYFKDCDKKKRPYTVTGLALALDTSRETLMDYEEKDEYSDTVKKAKDRVEAYAEEMLYKIRATGPIFALKNFGWKDQSSIDHTTKGKPLQPSILANIHVPDNHGDTENSPASEAD